MNDFRNKVQLIGNLGMDPEVKSFDGGRKLAKFSLATSQSYTNTQGEKVKDTQWHNIVVWGKLAEAAEKFLKKGSEVAVDGKIVYRSFEGKDGQNRYTTEIVTNNFLMLGKSNRKD
jgi:single-strand DNA-binding protein